MNKAEFISAVSEAAGSSKSEATAHVEAIINVVTNALKGDNEVTLVGFGTFKAKKRAKKTGRNIKKNTTIIIPEHHIPSFKPAKIFVQDVKNKVK